jgi:hypothetical protein
MMANDSGDFEQQARSIVKQTREYTAQALNRRAERALSDSLEGYTEDGVASAHGLVLGECARKEPQTDTVPGPSEIEKLRNKLPVENKTPA